MRSSGLTVFLLAVCLSCLGACAPAGEQDEDGSAEALAKAGGADGMATAAQRIAERLGQGDPSILQIPLTSPGAGLPSATVDEWEIAALSAVQDGTTRNGFLLVPAANAPPGSFGVVLADDQGTLLAHAVYVPDTTTDASAWAERLLDAVSVDGADLDGGPTGATRPQGLVSAEATGLAKLIAKLVANGVKAGATKEEKAGIAAVGRVAARAQSSYWTEFTNLFKSAGEATAYFARLAELRLQLGSRKVIALETMAVDASRLPAVNQAVIDTLSRRKNIALVMDFDPTVSGAVAWALEQRIPIAMGGASPGLSSEAVLMHMAAQTEDPAIVARLKKLIEDPEAVALIHCVGTDLHTLQYGLSNDLLADWASSAAERMSPLFALGDEALVVRAGQLPPGASSNWDFYEVWLRRFEKVQNVTLP